MMLSLVDDDSSLRRSLKRLLTLEGHTVQTAENLMEALDLLRNWRTSPQLILLDLVMPVLDGRGFLAARRKDPRLAKIA